MMALLFLAQIPFQVFFHLLLPRFFCSFCIRSELVFQLHQFLLCYGQAATLAHIMFGGDHVLHFAAAFWTVGHLFSLISASRGEFGLRNSFR